MTYRLLFILSFINILISCDSDEHKRMIVDDVIAEGNISDDTVLNGFVKFYDTAGNRLVMTANYRDGKLHGERVEYYLSGIPKLKLKYENGKANGEVMFFDSSGDLSNKQNLYYDIRVGESMIFKSKQIDHYYFYSFENKELLHIDYDSLQGKSTEQLNDTNFFFWHLTQYYVSGSAKMLTDLFIYLPNPPRLNFKYSLCTIDDSYTIKKVLKEFDSNQNWDTILLDDLNLRDNESFAIKLTIDNEFDDDDRIAVLIKKIRGS